MTVKKILALLLAAVTLLTLAACGGKEKEPENKDPETTASAEAKLEEKEIVEELEGVGPVKLKNSYMELVIPEGYGYYISDANQEAGEEQFQLILELKNADGKNIGELAYRAADCNHDGVIDDKDVELLNQAGTLLTSIDQSESAEVLLETSAEYVEYISLIDQSPEIEIEDETETDTDVETEPEQDATEETSFFEMIMNFIKAIIEMILTYIPVPWNN